MKYLLSLFLLCSSCFLSFSQIESKPVLPWRAPTGQDRFIIELHNDAFLQMADSMEIQLYSPGFDAHIMYDYPFSEKSIFSFAWGYGFSSFNIHHNGSFEEEETSGNTFFRPLPENYSYRKNKVSVNFVEIPLEFRLRTRGLKQFKMAVGAKVGYVVNVHTKIVDDGGKRKYYQLPNLLRYRYGLSAKIGVGRFNLSGFYSLSPLLKEGRGPELVPFTIGLSVVLL
ncbi:MAG: outer membrane beta-barrel protein [Flavobacteriales bacterium]|nr:outer membrane beta-barrel protein [Flavobacteriales bacterium]MDG1766552.1 outer membrane beta-barrel protein [Flavobacteriales bacterium]